MSAVDTAALWAVIGLVAGVLHMVAVRRAVNRLGVGEGGASSLPAWGYALRMAAFVPVLVWAARTGIVACLGFAGGHWAGRALSFWALTRDERNASRSTTPLET